MAGVRALLSIAVLALIFNQVQEISSECVDKVVDCHRNSKYCYTPGAWENYMKRVCQKTCPKHCDDDGTGGTGTGGTGNGKCGKSSVQQSRIIAGTDAKKGAWPWIVSLNYRGRKSHFCGASLVAPKWVLTASHCVRGKTGSQLEVIIGDHDRNSDEGSEQNIYVRRVLMNPQFNSKSLDHDIALLELEKPARFTKYIQPVCLPKKGDKPDVGTKCFLAGWGSIKYPAPPHHLLQQAILPVVPHRHCSFWDGIVCAGYGHTSKINACQGDSGGPFVCQQSDGSWVQHGVTSYVVEYCKRYTGFARVGDYVDWINKYISN